MDLTNRILHIIRKNILKSQSATWISDKGVSLYRSSIYHFGPDSATLELPSDQSIAIWTKTKQEIRHFYPIYGEQPNLNQFVSDIRDSDVVFDIGAHVGVYSCAAAQAADSVQVFAFEPNTWNTDRLWENATLNNTSIEVYECGLSDENAVGEIAIDDSEAGAVGHTDATSRGETVAATFKRGETLVRRKEIPKPTVIKIDVEGAELKSLRGLESVLDECRLIYCEVSDSLERYGGTQAELIGWLREHGFEIETLGGGGLDHEDVRAVRP